MRVKTRVAIFVYPGYAFENGPELESIVGASLIIEHDEESEAAYYN